MPLVKSLLVFFPFALVVGGQIPFEEGADGCTDSSCDDAGEETSLLQTRKQGVQNRQMKNFNINLDLEPAKRWSEVTKHYKQEIVAMAKQTKKACIHKFGDLYHEWAKHSSFDKFPEYLEEAKGMVAEVNDPDFTLEAIERGNLLYEMQSPTACSGVLWALPNGTVLHGRNMDYQLKFELPDGSKRDLYDVTFEVTFYKGGKPLYKAVQWPASVGFATAMRLDGGWSFEQNSRLLYNQWQDNLKAAKEGGLPFGLVARQVMDTVPDFETAVSKIYSAKYIAPSYFIMAGAGPYEGVVLTVDRLGQHLDKTPNMSRLDKSKSDGWHLYQSNEDNPASLAATVAYHIENPLDVRLALANALLEKASRDIVSKENLKAFMRVPPIFNPETVYTSIMIPAANTLETVLGWDKVDVLPQIKSLVESIETD
jgi:hypothetical protein